MVLMEPNVELGFRSFKKGVGEYKNVGVSQGPHCHDGCVRSYGNHNSGIMFVGISPARDETENTQRPLTGPAGQMLDACLEAIGLKREDVFCTNLICTWQTTLTEEQANLCVQRLYEEIKVLKPKIIIPMGEFVAEYLTGRKFSKVRGAVQWSDKFQAYVMCTYHSAAIYRAMGDYGSSKDDKASGLIYDFIRDLKKIKDVLEWNPNAPESKVEYRVVEVSSDAQNILDNLPRSSEFPIALDVETTYGKDDEQVEVFKDDVLCVGVGSDNFCWVFTPRALYNEDGTPALVWPDCWWTMHNSIFDSQVVRRKLGQWITIHEDTMLQSYSLDERSGVHGLKRLTREYLGAGFYEDDRFYGKLKLDEIPRSMLYEYNARDVVYTARLCNKFRTWQNDDNVRDFYNRILIPAVNMYKETQYHGVNIDETTRLKFMWEWGCDIINLTNEVQEMAYQEGWDEENRGPINISSPDQLSEFLFKILALPCNRYTKGGKPSIDRNVLKDLDKQHPFIPKLRELRSTKKMFGTYIETLPDKMKADGRAHPIVKLHGTATGRPSYTELAIQTFVAPSVPTKFNQMRNLVIPPPFTGYEGTDGYIPPDDDEYVIVECDYGKAELWQAYSYSLDPQILADLLSGDYHTNVAMDIYEKAREEVTKDDRTWAKRTTFGILYLIEENTLGELTNSSPADAKLRIIRWGRRNHVYTEWSKSIQKQIIREGELVSKTGRKRRIIVLGNAHRAVKQAVNYPIQSTSSDVVLDSAVRMHPRLKEIGGHVLFTVHDSIVTKALRSRLEEHCRIMHEEMTKHAFPGVVAMPIEIKIARNWGQVDGVHDCAESPEYEMNQGNNEWGLNLGGHCLYDYYRTELGVAI